MINAKYEVQLTASEIILLDGKVNESIQKLIDHAKEDLVVTSQFSGLSNNVRQFIADVIRAAKTNGKLIFRHKQLLYGSYSGRETEYWTHTRSTKQHKKGDIDYKRPKTFNGFELIDSFINIEGSAYLGDSLEFLEQVKPYLKDALNDVVAEIPEQLTGEKPKWKLSYKAKCTKCGWEGTEADMLARPGMMGGTYPGGCPKCKATNNFLGPTEVNHGKQLGFVLYQSIENKYG
jgi:hypothetical protein